MIQINFIAQLNAKAEKGVCDLVLYIYHKHYMNEMVGISFTPITTANPVTLRDSYVQISSNSMPATKKLIEFGSFFFGQSALFFISAEVRPFLHFLHCVLQGL